MRIKKTALLASATLAVATGLAAQANAAAFYLQEQSTKAIGRAFSGEVSEQGAQQQWWNPAAIGGITGMQSYVGVTAILPHADASDVGSTVTGPALLGGATVPVGGNPNQHNPVNNGYLPNGGFAIPLGQSFDFGFTMTSPYSFTTNYDNDSWARYGADKTRLRTFDFQPSIAYHIGGLSVGAGPNIEYVRATLSNFLPDPLAPTVNPDGHQYLKGSGWDVGYSFGFQYHNKKVDIGVSYKSQIKHTLKGHLIIDGIDPVADPLAPLINQRVDGAKASFITPWQVNFGARYHVTPALTLNAQVTRFGWDKFSTIQLADLPAALGNQVINENYHNTFSYAVGFDYKVSRKLTVRSGVQRDLSPISSGNRDPRVPDGNRWNFAAGGSYEMNDFMGVDFAASYDKIKSEPIDKIEPLLASPITETLTNDGFLHNGRAIILSLGGHMNF
ncbi:aromatic hydrocarbon degradation protein [Nostoc sp. 3335mG]|nr:aromatic hydrocarbon degradation protein [Nostoc sp. 3335mG]